MLHFVFLLLVVSVLSLGAGWLLDHDGMVSITWQGWQIEMSVSYALLILSILFAMLAAILIFLLELRRWPQRFKAKRASRHHTLAISALTSAWIAAAEGNIKQLERSTTKARKYLGDTPPTLLLALELAQQKNDAASLRAIVTQLQQYPETHYVGLRALIQQARQKNDFTTMLETAREAQELRPTLPQANAELLQLLKEQRRYDEALVLLEKKGNTRPFRKDHAAAIRDRAILYLMRSRAAMEQGEQEKALESAAEAYVLLPSFTPIAVQYAALLEQHGKKRKAASVRKKFLHKNTNQTWQCARCGHRESQWDFFCPRCGAVDSITPNATSRLPVSAR